MFERNKGKQAATPPQNFSETPSSSTPPHQTPPSSRTTAMIGPSIKIKGTVTGNEDLLIEGTVEGTIDLNDHEVSIGQSGKVTANIQAKIIKIDGIVAGDISGSEKVVISKSGNVQGNIVAPRVTLEDGAIFKGSIDMDPGDTASGAGTMSLATKQTADSTSVEKMAPQLDLKKG